MDLVVEFLTLTVVAAHFIWHARQKRTGAVIPSAFTRELVAQARHLPADRRKRVADIASIIAANPGIGFRKAAGIVDAAALKKHGYSSPGTPGGN